MLTRKNGFTFDENIHLGTHYLHGCNVNVYQSTGSSIGFSVEQQQADHDFFLDLF